MASKKAQAQARGRSKVWNFMGDDVNQPGEVRIIGKNMGSERVVERVDTGEQFSTKQRYLESIPDADDDEDDGQEA